MRRIVDVTMRGTELQLNTGRLLLRLPDGCERVLALEDVGVVVLSERAVSLTGRVLAALAEAGVPVVFCGRNYQPTGILQPLAVYHAQTGVLFGQIDAHPSTRARLWQRIVKAKIRRQAELLKLRRRNAMGLESLVEKVERGDKGNVEGLAARIYWQELNLFKVRDRYAPDVNRLLNYCYMVIYAAAARAICAAGLHPGLGLQHHNRGNACCLASDMMEPFRVAADLAVLEWVEAHPGETELTPACKAHLLRNLLGMGWRGNAGETSLNEALAQTAVSLRRCLLNNDAELEIPEALCV